jgi:hypothetical protein
MVGDYRIIMRADALLAANASLALTAALPATAADARLACAKWNLDKTAGAPTHGYVTSVANCGKAARRNRSNFFDVFRSENANSRLFIAAPSALIAGAQLPQGLATFN